VVQQQRLQVRSATKHEETVKHHFFYFYPYIFRNCAGMY
jgi:hypothetical protein